MSRHPEICWAQRSDKVFLTVELPDAKNPHIELEPSGKFTYTATTNQQNQAYEASLELLGNINVEESQINYGSRHTFCSLQKAEKSWWKRLLKAEGKAPTFIKVDWHKWVDEDEEDDAKLNNSFDMSGLDDFSKFENGGDSDDEDLPELEKQAK